MRTWENHPNSIHFKESTKKTDGTCKPYSDSITKNTSYGGKKTKTFGVESSKIVGTQAIQASTQKSHRSMLSVLTKLHRPKKPNKRKKYVAPSTQPVKEKIPAAHETSGNVPTKANYNMYANF